MTIRTLALDSGVTSIQDHRLALGAFMGPGSSVLERRGGVQYYPGAADLVSASSLQANVTPFLAIVDGTSNSLQGQIPVVVDANVTLTFSAGEPAVARVDRVILQIRDTTYDASGSTDARVLVLKGSTSTGAAATLPASSLLLWEVTVPIGASSITFSSARVDRRQWIASPLRVPVNSSTERDALTGIPGLEVTRLDNGDVEQYWSGAWRKLSPPDAVQIPQAKVKRTAVQSLVNLTDNRIVFQAADLNPNGMWSSGTNPSRLTVQTGLGGFYAIGANLTFDFTPAALGVGFGYIRLNGTTDIAYTQVYAPSSEYRTCLLSAAIVVVPGDYFEVFARGDGTRNLVVDKGSATFWAYRVSA